MPIRIPPGIEPLADDPPFEPARHLALEAPETTWSVEDFGYPEEVAAAAPFSLAMTSAFRVLSDEGVATLRRVVDQLTADARGSDRIARYVRGGVYRSRFLRDLCGAPEVTAFVSQLAGAPALPHTMPLYQGHLNLMPDEPGRDVDQWHTDTVALDWVLLVTDPAEFQGGQFEYFRCPRGRAARILAGHEQDEAAHVSVRLPAAGHALLQQGNLVMHRARQVTAGNERTTLVHSYVPADPAWADISRLADCKPVDPPEVLYAEWARHRALRGAAALTQLVDQLPYGADPQPIAAALEAAIREVQAAVVELRDPTPGRLVFYGGDALTDPQVG